jgi:hypothetical protein
MQCDARGNHPLNRFGHMIATRALHRILATTDVGVRRVVRI